MTLGYPLRWPPAGHIPCSRAAQLPFTAPAIRWIGDISYAIYLIHFAVIWFALHEISLPGGGSVWCCARLERRVYPISIAYAYLSARFLERPVRRWAQRYGRGSSRQEQSAARPSRSPAPRDGSAESPSVSIIVATHNRCDWLRLAMDSVLGQDHVDLELLVMDDGSTDDTPEAAQRVRAAPPTGEVPILPTRERGTGANP